LNSSFNARESQQQRKLEWKNSNLEGDTDKKLFEKAILPIFKLVTKEYLDKRVFPFLTDSKRTIKQE